MGLDARFIATGAKRVFDSRPMYAQDASKKYREFTAQEVMEGKSKAFRDDGSSHNAGVGIAQWSFERRKKLFEFSQKLMEKYELPTLLDALLDVVIQVTNADKGFIVTGPDLHAAGHVRVAETIHAMDCVRIPVSITPISTIPTAT